MRKFAAGIAAAALSSGIILVGAGNAAAEPVPDGTYQGTTDVPGGGLIWKGKTFRNGTVTNNFVFGLSGLSGNYYEDAAGRTVIDYGPSGLGFLTDTMVANGDGSYTGATYINGNQVGGFRLAR
ncbi:hypothetical protein [Rhodococcus sp. WAY2]|uniref:hypothetical protein n=1 Tax=Rhodococcus sp. WAY2 TaxID=2663121 RepID=UPI00131F95C8|nr:hypothetical protein [Rhodococcus sp. WAY2]QHE66810.1 hypothetical protein GFS60_00279 [Rhodococcus sp. WAY2]